MDLENVTKFFRPVWRKALLVVISIILAYFLITYITAQLTIGKNDGLYPQVFNNTCREYCLKLQEQAIKMPQNESIFCGSLFCNRTLAVFGIGHLKCIKSGISCGVTWIDGSESNVTCPDYCT
jgi:hypothetical protein